MAEHNAEIAAITEAAAAPTCANTIEALERSGRLLDRVSQVFSISIRATPMMYSKPTAIDFHCRCNAIDGFYWIQPILHKYWAISAGATAQSRG